MLQQMEEEIVGFLLVSGHEFSFSSYLKMKLTILGASQEDETFPTQKVLEEADRTGPGNTFLKSNFSAYFFPFRFVWISKLRCSNDTVFLICMLI